MDFENKNISIREYFETLNKKKEEMVSFGNFTEDEIKDWEDKVFALQYQTKNYLEHHEQYPDLYPEYLKEDAWIPRDSFYKEFVDLYDYLCNREIGEIALDKVSLLTALALTRIAVQEAQEAGIKNQKEQVVKAVGEAVEDITLIAENDKSESLIEKESGLAKGEIILTHYPKIITVMKDRVTQKVFKNEIDDSGNAFYDFSLGRHKVTGTVFLTFVEQICNLTQAEEDRKFTYYDWSVMEAVTALYQFAIDGKGKKKVRISVNSIGKMMKHDTSEKTRVTAKERDKIIESIRKLMSYNLHIIEDDKEYEGYLLNGEIQKDEKGRLCFTINDSPILYDYARSARYNSIYDVELEDVRIGMNYTSEKICIYRYLIERVVEIYGTLKMDDLIKEQRKNSPKEHSTNSIPLNNIIKAVYPDGTTVSDYDRKRLRIKESVEEILNQMKNQKFISDYKEEQKPNGDVRFILNRI